MKTKLIHKLPHAFGAPVGKFIRIYCNCGAVYEHPCPSPGTGCDLPCPRCHPEPFAKSDGKRLDA